MGTSSSLEHDLDERRKGKSCFIGLKRKRAVFCLSLLKNCIVNEKWTGQDMLQRIKKNRSRDRYWFGRSNHPWTKNESHFSIDIDIGCLIIYEFSLLLFIYLNLEMQLPACETTRKDESIAGNLLPIASYTFKSIYWLTLFLYVALNSCKLLMKWPHESRVKDSHCCICCRIL